LTGSASATATWWTARPEFRVGYDELHQGADNAASAGFVLGAVGKVQDAVVNGLEEMVLRGVPPATSLATARTTSDAAIRDYNRSVGS